MCADVDVVIISTASVVIIITLAITVVITFTLVFLRVKKQATVAQHDYDDVYTFSQSIRNVQDQHQHTTPHTTEERQRDNDRKLITNPSSLYATIDDTVPDGIRMQENNAYLQYSFEMNRGHYGTNFNNTPSHEIETEDDIAYL